MERLTRIFAVIMTAVSISACVACQANAEKGGPAWMDDSITRLEEKLVAEYGEEQRARLRRGMSQVASLWRESDGDAGVFEDFVARNFAGDGESLDEMFGRFERLLTTLYGNMNAIRIEFSRQTDLDIGRVMPFDEIFAAYSPSAHALEDFFENKLAFVVLLNFPLTTLEERIEQGDRWSRRQWAEARLAQIFSKRIPSDVNKALAEAGALSDQYISNYNIWMHHLVADDGERLFPSGMKLLSHWNLRDQIKADYLSGEKALARQRMIQRVMERIVDQTIPGIVIDNPHVDWNPYTNEISEAAAVDTDLPAPNMESISNEREPDRRYEVLLETYRAARMVDPYSPTAPSLIARRFDENLSLIHISEPTRPY